MFHIVEASMLVPRIYYFKISAPRIAKACEPGQFVVIRLDDKGERIPLTIADYDREAGTIDLVVQTVGASTTRLCDEFKTGDSLMDVIGPLGQPCDFVNEPIEELKKVRKLFIGGGLGAAPVYPQVRWYHEHGLECDVIVGSKNKDLLFWEDKMAAVATNLYVTTDDGSYGRSGMVTKVIEDLIEKEGKTYDSAVAIGPMIMMKFCCLTTKKYNIPTIVSMNPTMVDGTGMCGACRLLVGGEVKFACVDGPEFDGHLVDFDQAMKRQAQYRTQEGRALLAYQEGDTHHGGCGQCGGDK